MNDIHSKTIVRWHFENHELSWAGPGPSNGPSFCCVGTENGQLLFLNEAGKIIAGPDAVAPSAEAINNILFGKNHILACTRADITLSTLTPNQIWKQSTIHAGAHGLVASSDGKIIASAGRLGWILLDPSQGVGESDIYEPRSENRSMYAYRTIALNVRGTPDLLVGAMRQDGLGVWSLPNRSQPVTLNTRSSRNFDAVDVCGLGSTTEPLAVVALDRDGAMYFFRNALADRQPKKIKLDSIDGVAYRIMCCRGHIIILSSKTLYVMMHAADNYLVSDNPSDMRFHSFAKPMTAVDANLVGDKYVVAVSSENSIFCINLELVERSAPSDFHHDDAHLIEIVDLTHEDSELHATAQPLTA